MHRYRGVAARRIRAGDTGLLQRSVPLRFAEQ